MVETQVAANALRKMEEHPLNTFLGGISGIEIIFEQVRKEPGTMFRKLAAIAGVHIVNVFRERLQGHIRKVIEARCKKMIKQNIYQYTTIALKAVVKYAFGLPEPGVAVGKTVNLAVHPDPLDDAAVQAFEMVASHMICNKIADQQLLIVFRQKGMGQVIHSCKISYF